MTKHTAIACAKIIKSSQFHTKSWSYRFECPTCGKTRRYNTNFLGSKFRLVCDGVAIKRVAKEVAWREGVLA